MRFFVVSLVKNISAQKCPRKTRGARALCVFFVKRTRGKKGDAVHRPPTSSSEGQSSRVWQPGRRRDNTVSCTEKGLTLISQPFCRFAFFGAYSAAVNAGEPSRRTTIPSKFAKVASVTAPLSMRAASSAITPLPVILEKPTE